MMKFNVGHYLTLIFTKGIQCISASVNSIIHLKPDKVRLKSLGYLPSPPVGLSLSI